MKMTCCIQTPVKWILPAILMLTMAVSAGPGIKDDEITRAVTTELIRDNQVSANSIDVETRDGIVELTGETDHLLAKERAQKIASATVGVKSIVNRIKVEPGGSHTDADLAARIEGAWLKDPASDSYELSVEVRNGTATLAGQVDSFAEKELAETVAKGVRGVKGVVNDISIEYAAVRPDSEIEAEIAEMLENDVRIDDLLLSVEVNEGNVTLSGTVGSLQEKNRAIRDAWVAGVRSVNADDLEIEWWARESMRRGDEVADRSDREIEEAIGKAWAVDPRVASFDLEVSVYNGVAVLEGLVDNLQAKISAEEDAMNTLGVLRVTNLLKVRTQVPADTDLAERVADAFFNDPYINRFDISIEAYSGWIYLSGSVNTSFEKERAEQVAGKVKGALGLVNNLEYEYEWSRRPDWEIREQIREQLTWSPFVDADDITVSVDRGIATLDGSVTTWSERRDAEKNAYQGGARDVINNLAVDYRWYGPAGPFYYGVSY